MENENKMVVIGPTCLDVLVRLNSVRQSKKNLININIGGKGYNIAHTLSLFNVPTVLSTAYGKDKVGKYLSNQIKKQKIENFTSNVVAHPSAIFMALNNEDGDTIIDRVDTSIFDAQNIPRAKWEEISTVIVLSSVNKKILNYLKQVKKQHKNIKFCLESAGQKTTDHILPYLKIFDFFISNLREAEYMAAPLGAKGNVNSIIKKIQLHGPKIVIITDGSKGVYCGHEIVEFFKTKKSKKVISTIGAGDSFTAAFCAAYYFYGLDINHSIDLAMKVASITISQAQPVPQDLPKNILNILS